MIAVSNVCWIVVASAGIATRLAALIPLRIAQPICLGIEQGVQRSSTVPRTTRSRVALDPLIVNRDDIVQRTRCSRVRLIEATLLRRAA